MKLPRRTVIISIAALALIVLVMFIITQFGTLRGPESITWDEMGKRFLVSNTLGKNIVSMDPKGKFSSFLDKGLKAPRGIIARANNLFIADIDRVHIVDLEKAKITTSIPITGAKMLNDIALDKLGYIYVTDTAANAVFIINPHNKDVDKIVSPLLKSPNGIIYDMPRDQMLIVGFTKQSPILSLNTRDKSMNPFMDSIYSELDGIAIDDLGRIYFSSWEQDMIVEIPQEQNRFVAKYKEIKDAADMIYYLPNNELIIPLFTKNKIIRITLD